MNRSVAEAAARCWWFRSSRCRGLPQRTASVVRCRRAPGLAQALYEAVVQTLRDDGLRVETGEFQADMDVELVNDGPVTILLDSRRTF